MLRISSLSGLAATALCASLATPLAAGPFDDAVQLDVIHGWRASDGTHMAALRLRLEDGWKTYWRAPGDAGIPPSFEWHGAQNIEAVRFHWPVPEVFVDNGMRSLGYKHQVIIPVEITPEAGGEMVALRGEIHIGVCEEICVPVSLSFDAMLSDGGTRDGAIMAALLDRPMTEAEANVGRVTCRTDLLDDGLRLTATITMPPIGRNEVAVIEAGDPSIWVSEPDVTRSGNQLTAVSTLLSMDGEAFAVNRQMVRITVLGSERAVDIRGCTGA